VTGWGYDAVAEKDTEWSMCELIRKRFPEPAHVVIRQVRNAAAFEATNTADAFAMGVWPSRGLHLHGFEIKVSRSDWLNELKKPWKSDAFQPFCDFWWLVTSPGVVQLGELPEGWGHLERKGQRLECKTEPTKNPDPKPIPRTLLAAIVKRQGDPDKAALREADQKGYERGVAQEKKLQESERERHVALRDQVKAFEAASGVRIEIWSDGTKIGEAVRVVLNGDVTQRVRWQRDSLAKIVTDLDALIDAGANDEGGLAS
jgi:hypothetical protein